MNKGASPSHLPARVLLVAGATIIAAALLLTSAEGGVRTASLLQRPADDAMTAAAATGSPLPSATETLTSTPTPTPSATPTTPPPTATQPPTATPGPVPPFEVPAASVAILEGACGELLFGKEEHTARPPASLTKIVTALAVIDRVNLGDTVTVDLSGSELAQRTRSSVMGLEPGMVVTVEDLLYGLFLPSGNDAAIMLAKHVSGTEAAFADLMNETAQGLGMRDTTFDNPHGLDSPGLRSTAYDMALAGMALMQNPTLAAISAAPSYSVGGGLTLQNGNKLLQQYAGAFGVKIGYTRKARYTIVGAAARDDRTLFVAVLGSENLYQETASLLDWAFSLPSACPQGAGSP